MLLDKNVKKSGFGYFLDMIKGILKRSPTADEIDRAAASYVGHSPLVAACEKITKEHKGALVESPGAIHSEADMETETIEFPGAVYSEADIEAAKKQAAEDARREVKREYTARWFAEKKSAFRKTEIIEFCENGVYSGLIPKQWIDRGLVQFMECLAVDDSTIAFSEHTGKATSLQWFKNWLVEVRKIMPVSDINTNIN